MPSTAGLKESTHTTPDSRIDELVASLVGSHLPGLAIKTVVDSNKPKYPNTAYVPTAQTNTYVTRNFHGLISGELSLDEQRRVTGGKAYINYGEYAVIPLPHPEGGNPSWGVNTQERKLFVSNNYTIEFAEHAIAQAQVQYSK